MLQNIEHKIFLKMFKKYFTDRLSFSIIIIVRDTDYRLQILKMIRR